MIGWRGEPGKKDAPQHHKMGPMTPSLLDILEIPYEIISPEVDKLEETLKNAKKYMKPDATLVIIDGHDYHTQLDKEKVQKMGEEAGYQLVRYETFLSEDYIYVFRIKTADIFIYFQ